MCDYYKFALVAGGRCLTSAAQVGGRNNASDTTWEVIANEASRACERPAVSVVITLFNYSAYIRGCLDSVKASHDLPGGFEVVVVDDRSTDSSVTVVEEYMESSPMPICLVKKRANSGLADARNIGLLTAR